MGTLGYLTALDVGLLGLALLVLIILFVATEEEEE